MQPKSTEEFNKGLAFKIIKKALTDLNKLDLVLMVGNPSGYNEPLDAVGYFVVTKNELLKGTF